MSLKITAQIRSIKYVNLTILQKLMSRNDC